MKKIWRNLLVFQSCPLTTSCRSTIVSPSHASILVLPFHTCAYVLLSWALINERSLNDSCSIKCHAVSHCLCLQLGVVAISTLLYQCYCLNLSSLRAIYANCRRPPNIESTTSTVPVRDYRVTVTPYVIRTNCRHPLNIKSNVNSPCA